MLLVMFTIYNSLFGKGARKPATADSEGVDNDTTRQFFTMFVVDKISPQRSPGTPPRDDKQLPTTDNHVQKDPVSGNVGLLSYCFFRSYSSCQTLIWHLNSRPGVQSGASTGNRGNGAHRVI